MEKKPNQHIAVEHTDILQNVDDEVERHPRHISSDTFGKARRALNELGESLKLAVELPAGTLRKLSDKAFFLYLAANAGEIPAGLAPEATRLKRLADFEFSARTHELALGADPR